jgi:protein tyrosine/serine phosphatase
VTSVTRSHTKDLKPGRILVAGALVIALAVATLAQTEARYPELPNFHLVNSQLYRGAQPKAGGLQALKTIGIKTIINLRGEDDATRAEGVAAERLGLRYYSISLPGFSKPKDEDVRRILDIINAAENQPVFIHCLHGEDRTGTIIACYRIVHDGWTAVAAKKEAEQRGMSWTEFGMKRYIDRFYRERQK